MKKTWFYGVLLTSALIAVACGSNNKKTANRTTSSGARGSANVPATASGLNRALWTQVDLTSGRIEFGNVSGISNNPNNFSRYFLSTDWGWGAIGATSTTSDPDFNSTVFTPQGPYQPMPCTADKCFVAMALGNATDGVTLSPLVFQSGKTLSAAMASGQRETLVGGGSAGMTLGFYDSLSGTPDLSESGATAKPIPVWIPLDPQSYIQGNNVNLVFADELGAVQITGTLSGTSALRAQINFDNRRNVNQTNEGNAPLVRGSLGSVNSTNVCAYLKCN